VNTVSVVYVRERRAASSGILPVFSVHSFQFSVRSTVSAAAMICQSDTVPKVSYIKPRFQFLPTGNR